MEDLLKAQKVMMAALGVPSPSAAVPLSDPYLMQSAGSMTVEAAEVQEVLLRATRPWKTTDPEKAKLQFIEEHVDVLFYWLEDMNLLNVNFLKIKQIYLNKLLNNMTRVILAYRREEKQLPDFIQTNLVVEALQRGLPLDGFSSILLAYTFVSRFEAVEWLEELLGLKGIDEWEISLDAPPAESVPEADTRPLRS